MSKFILFVLTVVLFVPSMQGQNAGDYRTKANGIWNNVGTWETFDGTAWVAAVAAPTSADGVITVRNSHTVNITQATTLDELIIEASGGITLLSNITVTVDDGIANDIECYGTITFSMGIIQNSGQILIQGGGLFTWSGGEIKGNGSTTIGSNAFCSLPGPDTKRLLDGQIFTNNGTVNWLDGTLAGNSVVHNNNIWNIHSSFSSDGLTFNNNSSGILNKLGTASIQFQNIFNNNGTVNLLGGSLILRNGGNHSGSFTVGNGTILEVRSVVNFSTSSSITGNGEMIFGGIVTFNGTYDENLFTKLTGDVCTWNNSSTQVIKQLIIKFPCDLRGNGSFSITQTLDVDRGIIGGFGMMDVQPGCVFNMMGLELEDGRILNNHTTMLWNDFGMRIAHNSRLKNFGVIEIAGNFSISDDAGALFINQTGGLIKKNAPGAMTINAKLNNDGLIKIIAGSLKLDGIGIHNGQFEILGNLIHFNASQTLNTGSSITGPGEVKFTNGTVLMEANFDPQIRTTIACSLTWKPGAQTFQHLTFGNNCKLRGSSNFTIVSSLRIQDAEVFDACIITVLAGADFDMVGPNFCAFWGTSRLNNHSILNWTGGNFQVRDNFIFNNFGSFQMKCEQNAIAISSGARMNNHPGAVITRSTGSGTVSVNDIFFDNKGTVNVTSGTLELNSSGNYEGVFMVNAGCILKGGINMDFKGSSFTNNGIVSLNKLTFKGTANQQLLGSGTIHFLTIDGFAVILNGTQTINNNLSLTNGKVFLGNNNLVLGALANLNGGTNLSYLVTNGTGRFQRRVTFPGTYLFPVGTANTYCPMNITPVSGHNSDDLRLRLADNLFTGYDNNQLPSGSVIPSNVVNRTWLLDEVNAGGSLINFSIHWSNGDQSTGFNTSSCHLSQFTGGGWVLGLPANAGSGSFSLTGNNISALTPIGVIGQFTSATNTYLPLCAGDNLTIPYQKTGTYNAGNIFTAQLSNAAGSFSNPLNIGTVSSLTGGTINATIPSNTPGGTGYRIRVISSNPSSTGADNESDIVIEPRANAGTISGPVQLCAQDNVTYTSDGDTGGAWASSNTSVATINASTGALSIVSPGSTNISYTVGTVCPDVDVKNITIIPNANAGSISGPSHLCTGLFNQTFTSDGDAGGVWASSNPNVATIDASTGNVNTISAGTTILSYTVNFGCNSPLSSQFILTVDPDVNAGTISGPTEVCINQNIQLVTNGDAGGSWFSYSPNVATISASGIVTGVSAGTVVIGYEILTGCNAPQIASYSIQVKPNVFAANITGPSNLCIGAVQIYYATGSIGNAVWSTSNSSIATVNVSGQVTTLSAGVVDIILTMEGCNGPAVSTFSLTVDPNVSATLSGPATMQVGQTATFTATGYSGGEWLSSDHLVATINPTTGLVTATGAGTCQIIYSLASGCGSPLYISTGLEVTSCTAGFVNGPTPICIGAAAPYVASGGNTGGTWSTSNSSVAIVDPVTGIVTGINEGTATITYTVGFCSPSSQSITVSPNVNPGVITGQSPLCVGQTAPYTTTGQSGGEWQSSNPSVATVDSQTGIVTAVSAGNAEIKYVFVSGCGTPNFAAYQLTVVINAGTGPLNGVYDVGSAGCFATLELAINSLNTRGISGPVILNLLTGNAQLAPPGGYRILSSGSQSNPIIIKGNQNTITASNNHNRGDLNDAVFKIIGADYITIEDFVLKENNLNTVTATNQNNKTEWGIALLYRSTTDGAQNNTIQNNTIQLHPDYANTFGIYSNVRHDSSRVNQIRDISNGTTGPNHNNKIIRNIILGGKVGIAFIGNPLSANRDNGNNITKNIIRGIGHNNSAAGFVFAAPGNSAVYTSDQMQITIDSNFITTGNLNSAEPLRGIFTSNGNSTVESNYSIYGNNINLRSIGSAVVSAIHMSGNLVNSHVIIDSNIIHNCQVNGPFTGILNEAQLNTLSIKKNYIEDITITSQSPFTAIRNGASVNSIEISHNKIGRNNEASIGYSVFGTISSHVRAIENSNLPDHANIIISNNEIGGFFSTGIGTHVLISNNTSSANSELSHNKFFNLSLMASSVCFFQSGTYPANSTHKIEHNVLIGGYINSNPNAQTYFILSGSNRPGSVMESNSFNNFSNVTAEGYVIGIRNQSLSNKLIEGNVFNNISGRNVEILILEHGATGSLVTGNTISNISGTERVIGIASFNGKHNIRSNNLSGFAGLNSLIGIDVIGGVQDIDENHLSYFHGFSIKGISSTGNSRIRNNSISNFSFSHVTFGAMVGIITNASPKVEINNNKIYQFSSVNTNGTVTGIESVFDTTTNIFNNRIADLHAPGVIGDRLKGINLHSIANSNLILDFNTVYLNSSNNSSVVLKHTGNGTSMTLILRNNIFVNTSGGSAFMQSNSGLNNISSLTNNNLFYAAPLFSFEGNLANFTSYKQMLFPRETNAVFELPMFLSTNGASADFLRIDPNIPSKAESGGTPVMLPLTISTDIDNDIRNPTKPDIGADEFQGTPQLCSTVIHGPSEICQGSAGLFVNTGTPGGIWSSSDNAIASINPQTGEFISQNSGSVVITYSVDGCSSFVTLQVKPIPPVGPMSAPDFVCVNQNFVITVFGAGLATPFISSSNTSILIPGTPTRSGMFWHITISAIGQGTAVLSYYETLNGCNSPTLTKPIIVSSTVPPTLSCPAITAYTKICNTGCTYAISGNEFDVAISARCGSPQLTFTLSGATTGSGGNTLANVQLNKGITTITWTATNGSFTSTCVLFVSVTDNQPPQITCPEDIPKSIKKGCSVNVSTRRPTFSDNCEVVRLTWEMTGATTGVNILPGINFVGTQSFNEGTTIVTYTATDASGNTSRCSFRVIVTSNDCGIFRSYVKVDEDEVDEVEDLKVAVRPNPSNSVFRLEVGNITSEIVSISVFDVQGKLIETIKGSPNKYFQFGLNYLPGIYMVEVRQGKNRKILKLIKQ